MIRTFDILMVAAMATAATLTYQIKHNTDEKAQDVRRIETEIKLEKDTIELLKADWALLTQPNRLEKLATIYHDELQLQQTDPNQLARPNELPMLKSQVPVPEIADGRPKSKPTDQITTGSVAR